MADPTRRAPPSYVPPNGQKRLDWDRQREQVRMASRAWRKAVLQLIAKHPEDWSEYHRIECALASGLPKYDGVVVTPAGVTPMSEEEAIVKKLEWLQARLLKIEEEDGND
jgi:hypothetical protein